MWEDAKRRRRVSEVEVRDDDLLGVLYLDLFSTARR